MGRFLRARERALREIFSPEFHFHVPPFQRPYAWTEEEAGQLLSDVLAAMEEREIASDEEPPYFFGSIVIVKQEREPVSIVVDGQQRLTTLTILFSVLRDLDPIDSSFLQDHIIFGERDGRVAVSVRPRPIDARFFLDHVQRIGATERLAEDLLTDNSSQANILANALFFQQTLRDEPVELRQKLALFILNHCCVVEIASTQEDQAYKIFTIIHNRGLDLKENDVLKAEVLGRIPADRQEQYADRWDALENGLGRDRFTQLFDHIRLIKRPGKARGSLIAEVREVLDPGADPMRFVDDELVPKGRMFQDLLDASLNFGAQSRRVNQLLRVLRRLRHRDWMSPAIAFFCKRRRRPDDAVAFMRALERLAYAFFIQSVTDTERIGVYRKVLAAIEADAEVDKIVAQMELTDRQKQNLRSVLNGAIYNKERLRLPILLRIDEHLADSSAWYDATEVTVEHVLPQNPPPGSPWLEAFPDKRERKRLTDKLGNLALLSRRKNNQAANLPFEQKKTEYFARDGITSFAITTQILTEPVWTPAVIEARQKMLFDAACEIWRL